jgi:hypothetical protein
MTDWVRGSWLARLSWLRWPEIDLFWFRLQFFLCQEKRFARSANNPPFAIKLRRMGHPAKDGSPGHLSDDTTVAKMGHPVF